MATGVPILRAWSTEGRGGALQPGGSWELRAVFTRGRAQDCLTVLCVGAVGVHICRGRRRCGPKGFCGGASVRRAFPARTAVGAYETHVCQHVSCGRGGLAEGG